MSNDTPPDRSTPESVALPRFVRTLVKSLLKLGIAAALFALLISSVVFVDETEYVIIERLGHITAVYDRAPDRGLHFKLPWPIDAVRRFDRRLQLFDPPGREMFTADKKNVTIDTYICWRIADAGDEQTPLTERPVVRFFRGLGNISTAEDRLDARVRSTLSAQIGHVELSELLKVDNSEQGPSGSSPLEAVTRDVLKQVQQRGEEGQSTREALGIEVVDVRIKRLNLPEGNRFAVFERMKSERKKIADRYRSEGMAENKVIRSQADRQRGELLARADADAARIRGEGEAEAIRILNAAHAKDPEFYRFERTLQSYRKILGDRTTLVLSASSALLKLLSEGIPDLEPAAEPEDGDESSGKPAETGDTAAGDGP